MSETRTRQANLVNLSGDVSRRGFLAGLIGAGGMLLGVSSQAVCASMVTRGFVPSDEPFAPDVWISLAPDGLLTVVAHRSEMGTGIRTALPMLLADELGADWASVRVVQAPGDRAYGDQNTDGSRSVTQFYEVMRRAGATARRMVEQAAADLWDVGVEDCLAQNHQVTHKGSSRVASFAELATLAAGQPVPGDEQLRFRSRDEWRMVGGDAVPLVDELGLTTGQGLFGIDIRRPGMLHAVIVRPPVLGGSVTAFNQAAAMSVAGVRAVVPVPGFQGPHAFQPLGGVAVVADDTWSALQGREALAAEFSAGPHGDHSSEAFRRELLATANSDGRVIREDGDAAKALSAAAKTVSADYYLPHLSHAPMEPPCAVVDASGDRCEVWAPTQNPQGARSEVARVLGLSEDAVTVHVTLLGGGFGRKSKPDFIVEAALLSKVTGLPIHLTWTREDDLHHDYLHTVAACHMEAGLDDEGALSGWLQRSVFPPISSTFTPFGSPPARQGGGGELGMGFSDVPFAVPNLRVENGEADAHVRIGWLRSVAHVYHAFATCSFADEVAHARGKDPLESLLELLGEDRVLDLSGVRGGRPPSETFPWDVGRLANVTRLVAKRAGWGRELPRGRGLGIACHRSFLSYVANVIEVDVSSDGVLSIPKVHVVIDCGVAVHPDRIRAQMEGAAVFSTTLARFGEITLEKGAVVQNNFDTYQLARMDEAPTEVDVHIVTSDESPTGVGETGVPPFAPALCNAIFAATGQRIRELPLAHHDLSWS
ncbi:MAG: isoquinoline 1-oxidoreductase beta subunit [Pseudohongiellaceae bacterium]|jgi:isoquinoline 1-oxidoreductase beta subunit